MINDGTSFIKHVWDMNLHQGNGPVRAVGLVVAAVAVRETRVYFPFLSPPI